LWVYDLDGMRVGFDYGGVRFLSRAEAEADRNRRIPKEFARLEADILVPLESVVDKWKKITGMPLAVEFDDEQEDVMNSSPAPTR
jgi:hypothetical protein